MLAKLFVNRPRLAMVISLVISIAGLVALMGIPIAQYPQITPPEIVVSARYPGASAQVLADTVAAPIESQVNGVEGMEYMSSSSDNSGNYSLTVTFGSGVDPDIAQVNVQNRVALAEPVLPAEVKQQGVSIRTKSSDMLAVYTFTSPKGSHDSLFLSNYVSINIKDALTRVNGVSDVTVFGAKDYSMRVWLDPDRMAALNVSPDDVVRAISSQNIQAAAGSVGAAPSADTQQLTFTVRAKGRLTTEKEFRNIVIRSNESGGVLRLKDVARVELGAKSYSSEATFNGQPSIALGVYQSPTANALDTIEGLNKELERLSKFFPDDVEWNLMYDTTDYVRAALSEIVLTLFITFALVMAVTYIFLQDFRATLIPTLTIPVSLLGTFSVLMAMGYSANTFTLFALILAIGVVVDDAIVVVENVQRIMEEEKLPAPEATIKAMGQVTGPVIATTLVLLAVFVPIGFVSGITGSIYRQFAVTISTAVAFSSINALTLSPALCAILLRPVKMHEHGPLGMFNVLLDKCRNRFVGGAAWLIRKMLVSGVLFALVGIATFFMMDKINSSFVPDEDQGAFFVDIQLPDAAAMPRTGRVVSQISKILQETEGVKEVVGINGFSFMSGSNPNSALAIARLQPWEDRSDSSLHAASLQAKMNVVFNSIPYANTRVMLPPPIPGLGMAGGIDFRILATQGQSPQELGAAVRAMLIAANSDPRIMAAFSSYSANVPQAYIKLDRVKAETMGVAVSNVFATLQTQLGSRYVNDFNMLGRAFQVNIQAEANYRDALEDIRRLHVLSNDGRMVPLGSIATVESILGPQSYARYNQFPSAQIMAIPVPGFSSGQAMDLFEELAQKNLPQGYTYEWSGQSYQEKQTQGQAGVLIALALLFGYLFLVAQYESWTTPIPVMLSILFAACGALAGLMIGGMPLSIYAQIGLVLLVGLAAKNAILMVEFSRDKRLEGASIMEAATSGARIRFRAVLMTAFSFILGVFPMVIAGGAGAASRQSIGTTVFAGMVASTMVGIFFIPPLYAAFESMRTRTMEWVHNRRSTAHTPNQSI
ncbi:efflux RND transporter permease subunit [Oleidesulfovibrio sp.]|uniref:efflux RND transporter permease subunit n=1 Tax=Oleidesulfovibrio sp. TaxID=2909707 RepID=UPI003A844D66